jgi:hypothetical protein
MRIRVAGPVRLLRLAGFGLLGLTAAASVLTFLLVR